MIGSWIGAALLGAMVNASPRLARNLAIPYAVLEGFVLGLFSRVFDESTHGIVLQAVLTTVAVFAAMLALYSSRRFRLTPRLSRGIIAGTAGVSLVYFVGFIAFLVSPDRVTFMSSPTPLGIGISLFCAVVATCNFLLDFDFIERGAAEGIRKEWEWFGAFAVVVTLLWLYIEVVKLVGKLRDL
jgi:uncharacterized YccA/Bax inhibitor family protein